MKAGTEFELFCKGVLEQLSTDLYGYDITLVKHDVQLMGLQSGVSHQTDILCSTEKDGQEVTIAIECKDYKKGVPKEKVAAAHSYSFDTGVHPMIIASVGFQSGAIIYAESCGVDLLTIKKPENYDFKGLIKNINIEFRIVNPQPEYSIQLELVENETEGEIKQSNSNESGSSLFYNKFGELIFDIEELVNKEAHNLNLKNDSITRDLIKEYGDVYFKHEGELLKLKKLQFNIKYTYTTENINIEGEKVIKAIITNIRTGETKMVRN